MTEWRPSQPYRARHRRRFRNPIAMAWSRAVLKYHGVSR